MNEGTVSAPFARFIVEAVRRSGADLGKFAHLPDLAPEVLADDLSRISTPTMIALWEQLTLAGHGTAVGTFMADEAHIGALGLWDYLFTTGDNLIDSLGRAFDYLPLIGDPGADRVVAQESGGQFVFGHATGPAIPEVVEAIEIFVMALFLRRSRDATRRAIAPVHVGLAHRAPGQVDRLVEFFGTGNIDFEAPRNSITLLADDARAPLPAGQPGLDLLLVRHAEQTLAASKPLLRWHDQFLVALRIAFEEDALSLERVAQRLAMSPRTLQRRLGEHGTSWREEVEALRQQHALSLLRDTELPMRSIAARVGYSDVRALRRAVQRWHGQPPTAVRSTAS